MRTNLIAACLVSMAMAASGQNQVAAVTSSSPFFLRGATVTPGQGVPTWPILAGDGLKAGSAITILTFQDGSVLTLAPGSEAKVELANGRPVFRLISGTARYSLKSTTAVRLMAADQTVTPKLVTGDLALGGNNSAAAGGGGGSSTSGSGGFWTPGHTAAVLVGVGATAVGLGVGIVVAVDGGSSVSPSK